VKEFLNKQTIAYVLVGVTVVVQMILAVYLRNVYACQQKVTENVASVLQKRDEANQKDRQAFDAMFDALLDPTGTPESRRQAIVDYRESRRKADEQRKLNPIPNAPDRAC